MKFEKIYTETEENMRLALLALWVPGKHPMRKAIENLLKDEPLLAEPVFQSTFGWEPTQNDSWRGTLNTDVIRKLDIGTKNRPYEHQAKSWKALSENKSIVVTSGTGSGKTECFMYPVLSDLYEQERTNSIQAIFLYPLNALMEDQKKRLSEYCEKTGLKFAVYNGDTPEYHFDGNNVKLPNEVVTREKIRDLKNEGTRPQILLSNPSMLEYILVRRKDQEMLSKSAGKLRWIVIDEAHSYSGSAAVELKYQIKRILKAFDVKSDQVRFACTSATIGGEEGELSLKKFIANITGQSPSQIQVIGGKRLIPEIDEDQLDETLTNKGLPSFKRVLSLRKQINEVAGMSLHQMWDRLNPGTEYESVAALHLLDQLCDLKQGESPVLSLRAHFFMRAISGLYACANQDCQGSSGTPYGHLTTYKSTNCSCCGAPLLELVQCKRCGSFILMGDSNSQTHVVSPCDDASSYVEDYFSIDPTPDEEQEDQDELNSSGAPNTFFLLPYNREKFFNPLSSNAHVGYVNILHRAGSFILDLSENNNGKWVEVRKGDGHSHCPSCGKLALGKRLNFKHFRIPINFINQTIAPVLLHECAPDGKSWGKYIAFTDSRQGTAISAKTFNINVERVRCREAIVKLLANNEQTNDETIDKIQGMENVDEKTKENIINQLKSERASNYISLEDASNGIFDKSIFDHITDSDDSDDSTDEIAYKAALIRNFIGRKPLYENNIETMGLVTVEYQALKNINKPNSLIRYENVKKEDWRDYLKLMLDYFVRMGNHIQPLIRGESKYIRDVNVSTPIAGPGDSRKNVIRWPSLKFENDGSISHSQSRMIVLLCAGLGIETYDELQKQSKDVKNILNDAWNQLVDNEIKLLKKVSENEGYDDHNYYKDGKFVGCYYLDMSASSKTVCLKKTEKAWMCPVSGSLLDTTFCKYSPLIGGEICKKLFDKYRCEEDPILMPQRPKNDDEVEKWMHSDLLIENLKEAGLWNDRHKYAYKKCSAYIAAEHSAQQSKNILRKYIEQFSKPNPEINILQCSTTMEMGVNIGDIEVVLLDTIPPTAANYLQRVGRAGRKKQSKALAFSLCNNTPIGQSAFADPMWWAKPNTNPMIRVKESQIIIQRHINSFFFRQFICENNTGIDVTGTVEEFMSNIYDPFVNFIDKKSTNAAEEKLFHEVFGNNRYTIDVTRQQIVSIHDQYESVINELKLALEKYKKDEEIRGKIAVSNQINKCQNEKLLGYLSENQFIPNANMPTGVVLFDFTDRDQAKKLYDGNKKANIKRKEIADETADETAEFKKEKDLSDIIGRSTRIRRDTSASRDVRTALNEYAPEQTVVVNEKNYVSAGILLFGPYNEATQTKAIYRCKHCGHTEYSANLDEHKRCPVCDNPYHGVVDSDGTSYTRAYEPIGFRTDQNKDSSRTEKTEKKYYNILPILLETDWTHPSELNLCEVINSGDKGSILFYNIGKGNGFAFCKRCGRASIEDCKDSSEKTIPDNVKPGHKRLWKEKENCDANSKDIARHVVFTGRHQTCYSVLRFKKNMDSNEYENDEQLVYSLGVIITRALAKSEGIDEGELDFGVKQEREGLALFIYDTAKGGCGYSLKLANPDDCQEVLDKARKELEDSSCNCEEDGGACAKCLIDRNNYRFASKLSKAKALDWLNQQCKNAIIVPSNVLAVSPESKVAYQSLKSIARQSINSPEVSDITFCVSDNTSDYSVNDWSSIKSEMGKLIKRAIENGKNVSLKVEYHPEFHLSLIDKLPFMDLQSKIPDCNVEFVHDMGCIKTALIVATPDNKKRYFTTQIDVLSFSNNWGANCESLFVDHSDVNFREESKPTHNELPSEIIREGMSPVSEFLVGKYFSKVIAKGVLKSSDIDVLSELLKNENVDVTFSDMYVNSALSSLMLVYLIKEMRDLFGFRMKNLTLQLDSPRRKCINEKFKDYTYISFNFDNKEAADKYTDDLVRNVLGIEARHPDIEAEHHRWLKLETSKGAVVEIRPDHGISGGWKSKEIYKNLDYLDETVRVYKTDEDVLYYFIIRNK